MDQAILVREHIDTGRRLLEELDKVGPRVGWEVKAAYWFLLFDRSAWRLVLASPKLDADASFAVHRVVNDLIGGMKIPAIVHPLEPHLVGVHERVVVNFRAYAGTDPDPFIGERWISDERIGELYIPGAFVYRAERLFPEKGVQKVTFPVRMKTGWLVKDGELEFDGGRLKKLTSEDNVIPVQNHTHGITAQFSTVEPLRREGREEQTLVRRLRFSNGELTMIHEEIDPLSLQKRPLLK